MKIIKILKKREDSLENHKINNDIYLDYSQFLYKKCSSQYIAKILSAKDNVILILSKTIERLTLKLAPIGVSKNVFGEWNTVSMVAEVKGLTSDAVRKQIQNGNFEEGVDFKYNGSRILINQGVAEQIQRKRRNSDA